MHEHLVHNDFHIGNLLVDFNDFKPRVIDFEGCVFKDEFEKDSDFCMSAETETNECFDVDRHKLSLANYWNNKGDYLGL